MHGERGDAAGFGGAHFWCIAAVEQTRRQVPQQVDDMGAGGAFDQRADARADALDRGDRREDGKQDFGTRAD